MPLFANHSYAAIWAKVLLLVSLGKAFVAGAGLGLAALGVVDLAGTLGIQPVLDFIEHEHILDVFAFGGGIVGAGLQLLWKLIGR